MLARIKHEFCLSHGSTDHHLLEAHTTNNPLPTTIGISNSYWMDKSLRSTKSAKSLSILKPPCLHFLHSNHVSYIFKLGSQFARHATQQHHHFAHQFRIKNFSLERVISSLLLTKLYALEHTTSYQFSATINK